MTYDKSQMTFDPPSPLSLSTVTLTQLISTIICFLGTPSPSPGGRHLSIAPNQMHWSQSNSQVEYCCGQIFEYLIIRESLSLKPIAKKSFLQEDT